MTQQPQQPISQEKYNEIIGQYLEQLQPNVDSGTYEDTKKKLGELQDKADQEKVAATLQLLMSVKGQLEGITHKSPEVQEALKRLSSLVITSAGDAEMASTTIGQAQLAEMQGAGEELQAALGGAMTGGMQAFTAFGKLLGGEEKVLEGFKTIVAGEKGLLVGDATPAFLNNAVALAQGGKQPASSQAFGMPV